MGEITQILAELRSGDFAARDRLVEIVYSHLRALAGSFLRRQPRAHTLQPTALVHEAFVRLVGHEDAKFNDRAHFFAACAAVMRNILADHARRRRAAKRGGGQRRPMTLLDTVAADGESPVDVIALDEALAQLAALNARHARVVECRVFSGMTVPEIAEALGVAERTVNTDWATARAWLGVRLSSGEMP
ncbi:RNA polymerase sigma factor [Phycisphaerae bacterium RAS1]|nr:RNA polymerase sigma factor [Phycisphaerae bacterium RAS1]